MTKQQRPLGNRLEKMQELAGDETWPEPVRLSAAKIQVAVPLARYSTSPYDTSIPRYQHNLGVMSEKQHAGCVVLFHGCVNADVRLDSGKPVQTVSDAVKWLAERLAESVKD